MNNHEIVKNGLFRYYVKESTYGFAIYEFGYTLPLPFGQFCSENSANSFCAEINKGGPREVVEKYYVYKIAGNRDISDFVRRGVNPYRDWMSKNKNMFEREDRR